MNEEIQDGVVVDPRPLEAQEKDYVHLAGSVPIEWNEIDFDTLVLPSQRNQWSSFSCVFQACATALEVLTGKVISATPYFWRKNYPEKGSYLQDGGDIFYNRFTTTEELSPSQYQNEAKMNKIKQLTTNLGVTGYKQPYFKSIEQIAEAIELYGQCVITLGSNKEEYKRTPVYYGTPVTFYHAICGLEYGLVNGKKAIVCLDSTGQSSSPDGIRIITENYLVNRGTGALYFLGSKDVSVPQDEVKKKLLERIIDLLKQIIPYYKK
jgi:hypothetical protein